MTPRTARPRWTWQGAAQLRSSDRVLVVEDVLDRPRPLPDLVAPLAADA